MKDTRILEVSKSVQWIGVLDADIRTFDIVMETQFGTTYNSYLVQAQKKTIIETVKEKFVDVFERKLIQLTDPKEIQYIVINHTEPDHSGSVKRMLELAPEATVVGSGNAIRYLRDLLNMDFAHKVVKDGDVLDLGDMELQFIAAPNLHWPDSMFTYLAAEKVLFTCDLFGAHYCHQNMYDHRVGNFDAAFEYYFDVILKPFSKFILKAIEKIKNMEVDSICTGHGPVLVQDPWHYVNLMEKLARAHVYFPEEKTLFIGYVSAYDKTKELAGLIAQGVTLEGGIQVELHDIEKMPATELDAFLERSSAVMLGSPTINQNTVMPLYQAFAMLNPIRDRGKMFAAFGSYGWSGEAEKIITSALSTLKLKHYGENLFVKFSPDPQHFQDYIEFGRSFARKMLADAWQD